MNKGKMSAGDVGLVDLKTRNTLGRIYRPKGVSYGGRKRILAHEGMNASYHVMSRVIGGELLLEDEEKEAMRRLIWKMAGFLKVKVATYCVMGNHFHVLVRVQAREKVLRAFLPMEGEVVPEIDGETAVLAAWEERLLKHLGSFYARSYVEKLKGEILEMRRLGWESEIVVMLDRYRERFGSVQHYVKELKERFTRWYNKKHGRKGTLWMDRYKSVLVEDGEALRTMAAYIDLNPVRAGICDDPAEYEWSGYAEAERGSRRARRGLCGVMEGAMDDWEKHGVGYRLYLFDEGAERTDMQGKLVRRGVDKEKLIRESDREENVKLKRQFDSLLYYKGIGGVLDRVKAFTSGLVFGSPEFVSRFKE